jgi:hypothetical protein
MITVSQKNIDFGDFPDDPSADPIRSAFQKTQENFNQLFQNQVTTGVSSVNKTPGAGITVTPKPTGDVVISAKIACVRTYSSTLYLFTQTIPSTLPTTATLIDSNQTLYIELPTDIDTVNNINLSGNISATTGTLSSLNVSGIANLGNVSNVIIRGGTIGQFLTTDGSGNLSWATNQANGTAIINGNSNVVVELNGNVNTSVNGVANVLQVAEDSVVIASGSGGDILGANNITSNSFYGTLRTSAQPNITSVGILANLRVAGTANLGNVSNIIITGGSSGQVLTTDGSGNLSWSTTSSNIGNGTAIVNGNSSVIVELNGNVNTSINGVSNILQVHSNGANLEGELNLGNGTGGSLIGANLISANYLAGTITTPSQPNITSVGILANLRVAGTANLGNVSDVIIGGGANGQVLTTDGLGNLSWSTASGNGGNGTAIVNGTSNVLVDFNGNVNTSINGVSNILQVHSNGANLEGELNLGNGTGGSLIGANLISANYLAGTITTPSQPNITSIGTLNSLSVTSNANIGNLNAQDAIIIGNGTGGNILGVDTITANYFIGDGGLLSNISLGNVAVSNIINGDSNLSIPAAGGNITASIGGTSNIAVFSQSGLDVTGNLSVSGTLNAIVSYAETANVANNVAGTIKTPFSYTSASLLNLVLVAANTIITEISIIINTPFNGTNPTLSVGDSLNANRLFTTTDCLANSVGTYTVSPAYKYALATQLILTIDSGLSSTGEGLLIINFK